MLEVIALLVYLSRLIALARSRGRSPWWALGGLVAWGAGDAAGWLIADGDPLMATAIGLPAALLGAIVWYVHVGGLTPVVPATIYGRGNNFPCPWCASLQTEDRGGHLRCHACGRGFGH